MAVPKKKTSPSRRKMRGSHNALSRINATENPTTGESTLPHQMSKNGYYKGRQVVIPKESFSNTKDETRPEAL